MRLGTWRKRRAWHARRAAADSASVAADPLQWLEELDSPAASSWVQQQNARTLSKLGDPRRSPLLQRLLLTETTDTEQDPLRKLPQVTEIDGFFYDFWSDPLRPRGVWRRTTLQSFLEEPTWEVVLDLDELSQAEGESYVWRGYDVLEEEGRAMVCLSRGGSDAFEAREFDLKSKTFVEGGFRVPEAKSVVSFYSRELLLVSSDFGPGSLTYAGYPRCVQLWRRGGGAVPIFEGRREDHVVVAAAKRRAARQSCPQRLLLVQRARSFHATEWFLHTGSEAQDVELRNLDAPSDAELTIFQDFLLLHLRSEFQGFPTGALLAQRAEEALDGGKWQVLWAPEEDGGAGTPRCSSLQKIVCTRHYVVLQILESLETQVLLLRNEGDTWRTHWRSQGHHDGLVSLSLRAVSQSCDGLWLGMAGYLQPPALFYAEDVGAWSAAAAAWPRLVSSLRLVRRLPRLFEASAEQRREAISADGTRVPYTVLGTAGPTLVYAYGGFGIPLLPKYNGSIGAAWLERGGRYVEVNLRGGGEFGPLWEHAGRGALGRLKAYEDLEAVADALLEDGHERLALFGRSNGGLLVANQVVRELSEARRFCACVAEVPLTDMRRYHTWLAGHSWLEEYGDPDKEWHNLRQISAYHLAQELQPTTSLRVLVTTSTRDDRVHPCHARKFVQVLQDLNVEAFFFESQEGGHGGAAIAERAFLRTMEYEFLWQSVS